MQTTVSVRVATYYNNRSELVTTAVNSSKKWPTLPGRVPPCTSGIEKRNGSTNQQISQEGHILDPNECLLKGICILAFRHTGPSNATKSNNPTPYLQSHERSVTSSTRLDKYADRRSRNLTGAATNGSTYTDAAFKQLT